MTQRFKGLRRRGTRLAVAGVVSAAMAVGGVTVAGAATGPTTVAKTPATATAMPAGAAAGIQVTGTATQQLKSGEYVLRFDIKRTARYPKTVFSEITNEGKFNKIFPIRGAKRNLGQVGTKHNLWVGPAPFPVTVSGLTSISWQFKTRPGHPDHPGKVGFALFGGGGEMLRLVIVGVCALCGTAAYKAVAKRTWKPFATNIRTKVHLP